MPSAILLYPDSRETLVDAIHQATSSGRELLLEPGTFFTTPGRLNTITIGPLGLEMARAKSGTKSVIKRPDSSIPASAPDDNFGLFFVPARPGDDELAGGVWKPAADPDGTQFEFDVFVGGSITIRDLEVDANMGRQKLETLKPDAAAHSAMIGFAGAIYTVKPGPAAKQRRAYVIFRRVTLQNLKTVNGGFADDILFAVLGVFVYPSIQEVVVKNIVSKQRVDPHGGTLTFGAPPATVDIRQTDIFRLHIESDLDWRSAPRKDADFALSQWAVDNVKTQFTIFSMPGKIIRLNARRMTATDGCQLELLGGTISNGTLTVLPREAPHDLNRFFRLDGLTFDTITWQIKSDGSGVLDGLWLGSLHNDTCVATFLNNKFRLAPGVAPVTSGQLINSVYSQSEPGNSVTLTFRGCQYQVGFGSGPNTKIAEVKERGVWRFAREDFRGDPRKVIDKGPDADVVLIIAPSKTLV